VLEWIRTPEHGLLLHNLPVGHHQIEVRYDGERQLLEIDLVGGRVYTASFSLNRFFFYKQLSLQQRGEQIPVEDWLARFSDLEMDEVFLEEGDLEEAQGERLDP
jgi:hypothetical protein